jgi:hypothetical protein
LFATGSANSALVQGGSSGTATLNAAASLGSDTLFGGGAGTSDSVTTGTGTNVVVLGGGARNVTTAGTAEIFAGTGALTLDHTEGETGGLTQVLADATVGGGNTLLQIPSGGTIALFGVTQLPAANVTR